LLQGLKILVEKLEIDLTNSSKVDQIIRKIAGEIADIHYKIVHQEKNNFIPNVNFITHAGKVYDNKEIEALINSSLDFWLTSGRFANDFCDKFSEFNGNKYCILTNSGSSANLLALTALTSDKLGDKALKPGDEVLTVAASFPTTVTPIIQNGLIPVFCDVEIGNYNILEEQLIKGINEKTKAVILAHTLSNPFNLELVLKLKDKFGFWLIEDNCDAVGSKYNNKNTGTFGDLSTCSFFPAHHITMGEGGAILTNSIKLKKLVESFRDWGRDCWCETGHDNTCGNRFGWDLGTLPHGYDHKFIYSHLGYNLKLTDMQAAIGCEQLKKLPGFIKKRKRNWNLLFNGLKKYEEYFFLPKPTENSDPSWYGFAMTVKESAPFSRNEITLFLEENKIRTRLIFSGNIIRQPAFSNVNYRIIDNLKNTDIIMKNAFWFGCYHGITRNMIDYILLKFDKFMSSYK
tara:strand:+ start:607 stop:1983 length:1377 start_codon:yes stop_codon:yes gene_type:complete